MGTLYIPIGLMGSGKTTWAKAQLQADDELRTVCPDSIRKMFYGGDYVYSVKEDHIITNLCKTAICGLLNIGRNVFIDACNLTWEGRIEEWLDVDAPCHKVAVIFPHLNRDWHVSRRMKSPHGDNYREYWEAVFKQQERIIEDVHLILFDRVIRLEKGDVE